MKYLKNIENLNIENFYLSDKFELFIKFKGLINKEICFTGIENFFINKNYKEIEYNFLIDSIINRKIINEDYELVNKIFSISYDKEYFLKNIANKLSLLLIEGDITVYLMYHNHYEK